MVLARSARCGRIKRARAECGTREGDALGGALVATDRAEIPYFIVVLVVLSVMPRARGALLWPGMRLYARKVEKDEIGRSAALSLLARGMITPAQAAELAGVSRQLVQYWLQASGINWRRAWSRRQAGMWRKEIAALNGKVIRPPSKKEMRRRAERAKAMWDARQTRPSE
jgi:predicted HTH domain antitoxin